MMDSPVAPGTAAGHAARDSRFRWWLPALLGVASIISGIALQVLPDSSLRVAVALIGGMLVLVGITCLRGCVSGWAVLATVVASLWLLSGLTQLLIASTVSGPAGNRLLRLSVASIVVGVAFAFWPYPLRGTARAARGPELTRQ
jgi:uncharacterized membrane protein HdeD (DUF308 family)